MALFTTSFTLAGSHLQNGINWTYTASDNVTLTFKFIPKSTNTSDFLFRATGELTVNAFGTDELGHVHTVDVSQSSLSSGTPGIFSSGFYQAPFGVTIAGGNPTDGSG